MLFNISWNCELTKNKKGSDQYYIYNKDLNGGVYSIYLLYRTIVENLCNT